jgi:hypothetical protein
VVIFCEVISAAGEAENTGSVSEVIPPPSVTIFAAVTTSVVVPLMVFVIFLLVVS